MYWRKEETELAASGCGRQTARLLIWWNPFKMALQQKLVMAVRKQSIMPHAYMGGGWWRTNIIRSFNEWKSRRTERRNGRTALTADALAPDLHRKPCWESGMLWEIQWGKKSYLFTSWINLDNMEMLWDWVMKQGKDNQDWPLEGSRK